MHFSHAVTTFCVKTFDKTVLILFLGNLFSYAVGQHEVILLCFSSCEKRDLFPDVDIVTSANGVHLCELSHELQVLVTAVALEAREDTHRYVVGDVLLECLPALDFLLHGIDALKTVFHAHRPKSDRAPNRAERRLFLVQAFLVLAQTDYIFLLCCY